MCDCHDWFVLDEFVGEDRGTYDGVVAYGSSIQSAVDMTGMVAWLSDMLLLLGGLLLYSLERILGKRLHQGSRQHYSMCRIHS